MLSIKTNAGDKKGEEEEEEEGEGERQGGREREREVMAEKVRSEIQATPTQTPIVVVTNASKQTGGSAMDQSPQPGTQALAVLANVSTITIYIHTGRVCTYVYVQYVCMDSHVHRALPRHRKEKEK